MFPSLWPDLKRAEKRAYRSTQGNIPEATRHTRPRQTATACYCYCGAEQVFYGDMCPHTKHYSASISANSFYNIETGETDLMTSGVSGRRIVGAKLAIPSDNTLVFGGYIENCDSYGKSIHIKKIEQYYPEEQQ